MKNYSNSLDFQLNNEQNQAIEKIVNFLKSDKDVFILKGSAGTGKTSILKVITNILEENNTLYKLGAPTSRASSILSDKTGRNATTMHSQIYTPEKLKHGVTIKFNPKTNNQKELTIFIVDEASLVSSLINKSENYIAERPLLDDYIEYVNEGNKNNKIIFIGDKFQLPPVNEYLSRALNESYLKSRYQLKVEQFELEKVMRQDNGSEVLNIATSIRDLIKSGIPSSEINLPLTGYSRSALAAYTELYDPKKMDKISIICDSNRNVDYWNNSVRNALGLSCNILSTGDLVIIQTTWMGKQGEQLFKGEYGRIIEIDSSIEKFAELRFVNAKIEFKNSGETIKTITTKVLLDSLNTTHGILENEKEKHLYAQVMKHNSRYRETENTSDDKYLSALRLKHGFATTCHKAQGGEWDYVLIHPWRVGKDLPWTYTAVTRARKEAFSYATWS